MGEHRPRVPQFVPDGPYDPGMIVPLIKRSGTTSGEAIQIPERDAPISEPLAGELSVMYAFDLPGTFMFVAQWHCEELGLDAGTLRSLSVRNLRMRRSRPQLKQTGTCVMFILDGDLETSLLLADIVWQQLAPQIPGDLIAAVPARDTLAVTGTGVAGGREVLQHAVSRVWDSPRANRKLLLTRSLLMRQGTTWQLMS